MSKKLQGNGLWESSRMMLPEHKSTILKRNREFKRLRRPVLHEDEWEVIIQNIEVSLNTKSLVEVQVFTEWEYLFFRGVISQVNQLNKNFKIILDDKDEWINIDKVVGVNLL